MIEETTDGKQAEEKTEAEGTGLPVLGSLEALRGLYTAPGLPVDRVEVVEATEIEIRAAVIVLQARSLFFAEPVEVSAYPFNPKEGWRQAGLNFIRKNREEAAKGRPIVI